MKYSANKFSRLYTELCEAKGLSPRRTLKEVFGMDGSNLQKWRSEESTPKADLYLAVAEYFAVPVDYLYGRELSAEVDSATALTPAEQQVIAALRRAAPEKAALAQRVLAVILEEAED